MNNTDIFLLNDSSITTSKILDCNKTTEQYGIIITPVQAALMSQSQSDALKKTGRIEFGTGIADKLINAFSPSPYMPQNNYDEFFCELINLFYEFKNETHDALTDAETVDFMKSAFDGFCRGSLELLSGKALSQLARHINSGNSFKTFRYSTEE